MSFLAKLRTQASTPTNVHLCYLLTWNCLEPEWHVHLRLHQNEKGPIHQAQAYQLQRAHLKQPPNFMSLKDQDILRSLIDAQTDWPSEDLSAYKLPSWHLLKSIIHTGRCYYRSKEVSLGEEHTSEPFWKLDAKAQYCIRWRLPQAPRAHCMLMDNELLYRQVTTDKVIIGRTKLSKASDSQTIDSANRPTLELQALEQIRLSAHSPKQFPDDTLKLPLALPAPLALSEQTIKPRYLLFCDTDSNDQAHLSLAFSLSDESFCSLPQTLNEKAEPKVCYWNGSQLVQLRSDFNLDQETRQTLLQELDWHLQRVNIDHQANTHFWQGQKKQDWRNLFSQSCRKLQELGAAFVLTPQFPYHYVVCKNWNVAIGEDEKNRLQLQFETESQDENISLHSIIKQLKKYNRQRKKLSMELRLDDGRILLLPKATSQLMEELADLKYDERGFYLNRGQSYRLAQVKQALPNTTQWDGLQQELNQAIAIRQSPAIITNNGQFVNAILRPYQWLGVCWIHHLKQQGANGLLADDMGLGKTLQTISLLAYEKHQGLLHKPALIVLPLGLLYNWANELKKFAPQLSVHIIHGNKRHSHWQGLSSKDILLTTYQSASLDLEQWQQQDLSWLILDEAQTIKNPKTRWSQALREISSDNRLCLSGTPMENHLGELWSIMDFLIPGCLGSQTHFQQQFRKPIETEGNTQRLEQLLERISPFMLRRTKDQIAKDLPPKTEIIHRIPLDPVQQTYYQQFKHTTQDKLANDKDNSNFKNNPKDKTKGNGQQSIALLTALLKLRQACCDPSLLGANHIPSAKKTFCLDMLEELVAEGRAVLVFSQFTEMLTRLQQGLNERHIDSLMLSGKTQKRQELVDAFQAGAAPVFFISLKAGGTGLNLTRADTVIHYDPWWNAAAENQASDRAHRIGQDKPVFIYKLIAADTIEEKIAQLQAQKKNLSHHIDQQAILNADQFSLKLEEMLSLLSDSLDDEHAQDKTTQDTVSLS